MIKILFGKKLEEYKNLTEDLDKFKKKLEKRHQYDLIYYQETISKQTDKITKLILDIDKLQKVLK